MTTGRILELGAFSNRGTIFLFTLFITLLAGCTMAPKYKRPAAPVSSEWPGGPAYGNAQTNSKNQFGNSLNTVTAEIGWREFFNDPRLQELIGLALRNNRDLRVAVLNVESSRSQYRIYRSALLPAVDATGTALRQRNPAGVGREGGVTPTARTFSQYTVGVGVTGYELDLFGRVRSLKAQALENYLATDETRLAAQISLVAEVANQYLTERNLDELLAVTQQTLESVNAYYKITKTRFEYGNTSELDLRSIEAQVQAARANVADYKRQRAQAENALVFLIGQPLPNNLPKPRPLLSQNILADLPPGLPSDMLERRPDVRAAEHQLKAANANIGAARAAFFPKITLTGSAGTSSSQLEKLFAPGTAMWSFNPEITVPIFEMVHNKANLDVANIRKRIGIAQYEKAIQGAFRDVADALAGRATLAEQIEAEEGLVNAEQKRYDLADVRYRNGVDSYLTVLTAQQDLYAAQQRLIQSQFFRLANLVSLYKALGGGWQEYTAQKQEQSGAGGGKPGTSGTSK